jgi:sulfide:quinone oxidoreductase
MFSVPKYAEALDALRQKRGITGLFQHQLTCIDSSKKQATFRDLTSGKCLIKDYDLLHVTPPQQALKVIATSPLADESSGFVKVDSATLQHKDYPNVFAIGDSAGLPTSKTAAAISSQAPVLVDNLIATMDGTKLNSAYQGYSSCPLLTGHGELMLCEFKYGGEPAETFAPFLGSQHKPRRLFYHLKKDIFPPVYWNSFLKGSWFGR